MSNSCRIHLTYKGGYISKEVTQVSSQGSLDEITVGAFKINAGLPNTFSRCFIEVALLPLDLCPSFGAFFNSFKFKGILFQNILLSPSLA